MKPISTRTHGFLDYFSVGVLLALPRLLQWRKEPTRLLTASAVSTLVYSLLTRYEWGLVPVLPVNTHLALDATSGTILCGAPFLLASVDRRVAGVLLGLGLFEIVVPMLTENTPGTHAQEPVLRY